jgi:predicted HicB family RNase H-like nuclease
MKYKGYTGFVELDEDSGTLFGRVIGLRDVITFQATSVPEVIQAFHDSVDVYLEFCAARGESPEKPYSGQFVLRVDPQLHRAMAHAAEAQDTSLNALIEGTLRRAFGPAGPGGVTTARAAQAGVTRRPRGGVPTPGGLTYAVGKRPQFDQGRESKGAKGPRSGKGRKR